MKIVFAVLVICLCGCAQPRTAAPADAITTGLFKPRSEAVILDHIVEHWIRQKQDRAMFLYLDALVCALPVIAKLRDEGFKIYSKGEPKPPRNSWDNDDSVSWLELDVGEIQMNGDEAKARVTTNWRGGFLIEDYSLSRRDGKWIVTRTETLAVT